MALTKRERYMVIGIVAVVAIAAIIGAFLIGRGSGDEKSATTATTGTQTQTTPTQTQAQTVVQTVTTPPAPVSNVEVVEQSVNPVAPARSTPIVCTVRTRGDVASVKMNLTGRAGFVVDLNKGPTVNGITNWTQTVAAPDLAGAYKYNAMVTGSDGKTVEGPATPFTVVP